jgi:hypothetical protein
MRFEPAENPKEIWRRWPPWLLLLLIIATISVGVHRKAYSAKVPPVFDAFGFYSKAFSVWQQINAGHPERVFQAGQTSRPPGSTVISAPFGFRDVRKDFKGFFFRNIMVPVWMWGAAAALLLIPLTRGVSGRWLAAGTIGSLIAMPMFYQMEWNPGIAPSYTWGFQDTVVAAFAALSLALLLASVRGYRLWMSLLGGVLLAWTIFIKPVGLLLMPLVFGQWLVEMVIRHWPLRASWRESAGRARRYAVLTIIVLPLLFLAVGIISFRSAYLSKDNWAAAQTAQQILLGITSGWQPSDYVRELRRGLGYFWFPVFVLGIAWTLGIVLRLLLFFRFDYRNLRVLYAFAGFCAALIWWVKLAGPLDRYMFPFQLCFLLAVVPPLWEKLQQRVAPLAKTAIGAALFVPPLFLSSLLWTKPSDSLQRAFHLNLSSGRYGYSISAAKTLLKHAGRTAEAIRYYKSDQSWSIGAMEAWLLTRDLADPKTPDLQAFCPLDWSRPILVRRKDLVQRSDFIVVECLPNPAPVLALKEIPNPHVEKELLTAWLAQLTPDQGVKILQDGPLRLMQITDRTKLDEAFIGWMAAYKFRPEFYAENQDKTDQLRVAFQSSGLVFSYPNGSRDTIRPAFQATVEETADGLQIDALGNDAQLELPKVHPPEGTRLVIRARLQAPAANGAEIFWSSSGATPDYHADRSVNQDTAQGMNELYFELPPAEHDYYLRFDPGSLPGRYLLRSLDIAAVPASTREQ